MAAVCFPGNRLHAIERASPNPSPSVNASRRVALPTRRSRFIEPRNEARRRTNSGDDPAGRRRSSVDEEYVEESLADHRCDRRNAGVERFDPQRHRMQPLPHRVMLSMSPRRNTKPIIRRRSGIRTDGDEPEANASASHHVDPMPPSGFRLFGFGGKNKKDDEVPARNLRNQLTPELKSAAVSVVVDFRAGKRSSRGRSDRRRGV